MTDVCCRVEDEQDSLPNRKIIMIYVGVDGCRAGWLAVLLNEGGAKWKVDLFPDISTLFGHHSGASLILIDIPIGLRDSGPSERLCDIEARKMLAPPMRQSSVFPVPCRPAVYAQMYDEANRINEHLTGRRLSIQTWNIVPKIREVDTLLTDREAARSRMRESHPEICFRALAGHAMEHSKKTQEGFLERKCILQSFCPHTEQIIDHVLSTYQRAQIARDDILDALVLAVTAVKGNDKLVSIPETPEFDSRGIRMEIVYSQL
jgi:predicted RNase H-like nuclease